MIATELPACGPRELIFAGDSLMSSMESGVTPSVDDVATQTRDQFRLIGPDSIRNTVSIPGSFGVQAYSRTMAARLCVLFLHTGNNTSLASDVAAQAAYDTIVSQLADVRADGVTRIVWATVYLPQASSGHYNALIRAGRGPSSYAVCELADMNYLDGDSFPDFTHPNPAAAGIIAGRFVRAAMSRLP